MSIWNPLKSKLGTLLNARQQPEKQIEIKVKTPSQSPLQPGEIIPPNSSLADEASNIPSLLPQATSSPDLAAQYYKEGFKSNVRENQIALYLEALRIKPDYVEVLYSLAMAYKRALDNAQMYAYLRKIYDIDKSFQDCCKQLATISLQNCNYLEASGYYEDAVRFCAESKQKAELYSHLAFCHYKVGNGISDALPNMHQALVNAYTLDITTPIKMYLGIFSEEIWFRVIEDTAEYNPKLHGDLACYKAERYWRHGFVLEDRRLAENYYLMALENFPDHLKSHYSLGCHFIKSNKTTEALYHFLCIEKCHPNYEDVRTLISRLVAEFASYEDLPRKLICFTIDLLRTNNRFSNDRISLDLENNRNKEIEELAASVAVKNEELERLALIIASLRTKLQASCKSAKQKENDLFEKEIDFLVKLKDHEITNDLLRQRCAKFEKYCEDGPKYIEELSCRNRNLTAELQQCSQRLLENLQTCDSVKAEYEVLHVKVRELEVKNKNLKQLHTEMVSFAQNREIDLDEVKRENLRLKAELAKYAVSERNLGAESSRKEDIDLHRERNSGLPSPVVSPQSRVSKRSTGTSLSKSRVTVSPPPPPRVFPFHEDSHEDIKI